MKNLENLQNNNNSNRDNSTAHEINNIQDVNTSFKAADQLNFKQFATTRRLNESNFGQLSRQTASQAGRPRHIVLFQI